MRYLSDRLRKADYTRFRRRRILVSRQPGEAMSLEDTDNLAIFTPTDKGKAELRRVRPALDHRARTDGDVRRKVAHVGDRQAAYRCAGR